MQAAISAAHAAVTTGAKIERYIPTPDASRQIPDKEYHQIYKKRFKEPTNLIRFSATVEDTIGCPYVMDEEDEAFLKKHSNLSVSEDDFEKIMWQYETACKEHWPHLNLVSFCASLSALKQIIRLAANPYPFRAGSITDSILR